MSSAYVRLGSPAEQVMVHPDCMLCIRHGQTAWNAADRLTTRTDVPLDDTGRAQAELVAHSLRGAHFARAWPLRVVALATPPSSRSARSTRRRSSAATNDSSR